MPDRPRTFSSRTTAPRSRPGGSATIRDRSAAYRRLRERILADEPLCRYCRSAGLVEAATVVDHIVALAIGGTDDPANLAPACRPCNDAKAKDEQRFIARGYDMGDVMRDPALAEWIAKARSPTDFKE